MEDLRFDEKVIVLVTSNDDKVEEFNRITQVYDQKYKIVKLGKSLLLDEPVSSKCEETLVRKKVLSAFKQIKRPVIVEHTTLEIAEFNGLPGNCTQKFFDSLGNYDICKLMHGKTFRYADAYTYIGYCDGKKTKVFKGKMEGAIAHYPKGKNGFGWDSIFIPMKNNRGKKTLAEMNRDEKNGISMRKDALKGLVKYLSEEKNEIDFYDQSNKHYESLMKQLEEGKQLVLFIGAGFTRNAGFPSWWELLCEIGNKSGYSPEVIDVLSNDMIALGEFFLNLNAKTLHEAFKSQLSMEQSKLKAIIAKSMLFHKFALVKAKRIYTTNYDKCIEYTYDKINAKPIQSQTVSWGTDFDQDSLKDAFLVKLHGDIDSVKSLQENDLINEFNKKVVLSESSYYKTMNDVDATNELFDLFVEDYKDENNIFLFLGYGLGDFNIKSYISKAVNEGSESDIKDRIYYFTTESNPVQEQLINKKGINTIVSNCANKKSALKLFLYEIVEAQSKVTENQIKEEKVTSEIM